MMSRESLPSDFFDRLSPKKEGLLQVLLDADGEWIEGPRVRQQMRDQYGLSVPDKSGAIASHQGHFTQRYSKQFSRDVINVRWANKSKGIAEYRIGDTYRDELGDYFGK